MSTPERAGLMLRIARELRALLASLDRLDQAAAGALAISRNDLRALALVARLGSLPAGRLARQLRLTSGAVTTLLDRMEDKGLMQRVADPRDRRRVVVMLSLEGGHRERELFAPLTRESAKWLARRPSRDLAVIEEFLSHARSAADTARARIEEA